MAQPKTHKPIARYLCVFLLGVVTSLVGIVRADYYQSDTGQIVSALREQTKAIQALTNAVSQLKR